MNYVYTNDVVDFEVEFSKLGLTIRKLNEKEKDIFINRYKKVYNLKKRI